MMTMEDNGTRSALVARIQDPRPYWTTRFSSVVQAVFESECVLD
jgi:hypothetical protein